MSASSAILNQLPSLITDRCQVVSYKWLSRNYSISSNAAKRLLQDFVESYEQELQVVFAVSGWLKGSSRCYTIRLATKEKLEEAKSDLEDPSVCVYSVQSLIPKDPSVLWNAEFMQAEELYNQPSTVNNCLRDNRFSAILYSSARTSTDGNATGIASIPEKQAVKANGQDNCNIQKDVSNPVTVPKCVDTIPPTKTLGHSSGVASNVSSGKMTDSSNASKICTDLGNTKKGQVGKAGGSLASLWGRASKKSKLSSDTQASPTNTSDAKAVNADDQIKIWENADVSSEDEEYFMQRQFQSNGSSARKRRVVLDMSDDENEDGTSAAGGVVSLASPEVPKKKASVGMVNASHNEQAVSQETGGSGLKGHKDNLMSISGKASTKLTVSGEGDTKKQKNIDKPVEMASSSVGNSKKDLQNEQVCAQGIKELSISNVAKTDETCLTKNVSTDSPNEVFAEKRPCDNTAAASKVAKKRKILKTHVDERGREVSEVMWEGDDSEPEKLAANDQTTKASTVDQTNKKALPATRMQSSDHSNVPNPSAKAGAKQKQKGGAKDSRQGNILSFFKKK